MTRLSWNAPSERFFETGLDRGVFYPKNRPTPAVVGTNDVLNPRAEIGSGVTLWTTAAGAGGVCTNEHFTSGGWNNLPYRSALWTTAPTSENYQQRIYTMQLIPVVENEVISVGLRGWRNSTKSTQLIISLYTNGVYVTNVTSTYIGNPANTWALIKKENILVPAGINGIRVDFYGGLFNNMAVGDRMSATALMVARGETLPEYFDGETEFGRSPAYICSWSGAPNNSISEKRAVVDTAFPWNGLTNVEESGGEEAIASYIDGRPYLYFPPPKDYAGTLSAYTYPDEFANVMGLQEVDDVDGMYLDSQVGDTFDLSYRTLVGDGVKGQDLGYKIHLVYNATATPQGKTFESLSDNINPTEFSWDLKAVPVAIEGYRPTAHVVIDTRHMTATHIANVEEILYGDDTTAPSMPSPEDLMELLTFGDAIIITDNGDGTWTAEGPRSQLHLIDVDTFTIEDVETTDYGNGTFQVSTTP